MIDSAGFLLIFSSASKATPSSGFFILISRFFCQVVYLYLLKIEGYPMPNNPLDHLPRLPPKGFSGVRIHLKNKEAQEVNPEPHRDVRCIKEPTVPGTRTVGIAKLYRVFQLRI
jgi:hypothetical protein